MEKLRLKRESLSKALLTLRNILDYQKQMTLDETLRIIVRDSVIQRFEFSFELFWKYLMKYLERVVKAELENRGPRGVIEMSKNKLLISEVEYDYLIDMLGSRNLTSHEYKEKLADQANLKMEFFYNTMIEVANRLVPKD